MTTLTSRPPAPITYQLLELLVNAYPALSGKPILSLAFAPPFILVTLLVNGVEVEVALEDLI